MSLNDPKWGKGGGDNRGGDGNQGPPDLDELWRALRGLYPIAVTIEEVEAQHGGRHGISRDFREQLMSAPDSLSVHRLFAEWGSHASDDGSAAV